VRGNLRGQLQFSPLFPLSPLRFGPNSNPSDAGSSRCGAVLVRSCAELYLAEMHNRCNLPHRSDPQRCQVAGRQRAGMSMAVGAPSIFPRVFEWRRAFPLATSPATAFENYCLVACCVRISHHAFLVTDLRMAVQVPTRRRFPARQRVAGKSHQCSDDNPCLSHKSSRICMGEARHVPSAVAAPLPPPRRLCLFSAFV